MAKLQFKKEWEPFSFGKKWLLGADRGKTCYWKRKGGMLKLLHRQGKTCACFLFGKFDYKKCTKKGYAGGGEFDHSKGERKLR